MITWENYEAMRAFERSRSRAFLRMAKASILGRKKGLRYSGILPKEEYSLAIDDLEMLDIEGSLVRLPALPASQMARWIKEYKDYALSGRCSPPFATRLEKGRLVLEGGMRELLRLELLRAFGEINAEARMSAIPGLAADIIEYPGRLGGTCRSDMAAS